MTNTTYISNYAKVEIMVDIESYGGVAPGDLTDRQLEIMEALDDEGYVQLLSPNALSCVIVRGRYELTSAGRAHLARWREMFAPRSTNLVGETLPGER